MKRTCFSKSKKTDENFKHGVPCLPVGKAYDQLKTNNLRMKTRTKKFLFWTPRILCMLFAGFISIFAMDVFDEKYSFRQTIFALFIHLIPAFFIIIILLLSWKWEWIGGVVFNLLGVLYIVTWKHDISAILIISGPLFILGFLFVYGWIHRKKIKTKKMKIA